MPRKSVPKGSHQREFAEGLRLALMGWPGCIEWHGNTNGRGYGRLRVDEKIHLPHRLAWEAVHGPVPAGKELDHACHNPRCYNPAHLRLATHAQNRAYTPKPRHGKTSRFKGVHWNSRDKTWYAVITINYRHIHLGCFRTEEAAARAYDEAARRFWGEFAWTNGAGGDPRGR